jgi:hypothetical protein
MDLLANNQTWAKG